MSYDRDDRDDRKKRKSVARSARAERARTRARKGVGVRAWEPLPWQAEARDAFRQCDVLIFSGFPGTSKTACATWLAVEEVAAGRARKVYLLRPAVEAGPSLGYLPGGVLEKQYPYLVPVFEFLGALGLSGAEMIRGGSLEVVAVQHAKGRTFHGGVVLVDECQDLTARQLRLVLSRTGANAKLILTGDPNQSDVPEDPNAFRALVAKAALATGDPGRDGFKLFRLTEADVMRHEMVPTLLRMCGGPK